MDIKLHFLGAARNVTGSKHLVEACGITFMADCGLYQERHFSDRNWDTLSKSPASIDYILLTHAHLDHCGLIPKLVKDGFRGKIICTEATAEIVKIILLDSGKVQEEDAAYKQRRHKKEGREGEKVIAPLYTKMEAEASFQYFKTVKYLQEIPLNDKVFATLHDAGHVLGSAMIKVTLQCEGQTRSILFSGDIGRPDRPIVCDPGIFHDADYVLVESTYGDRDHAATSDIKTSIGEIINETVALGGKIIVPSFALERSQELLYHLNELVLEKAIKPLSIFLDSPMASRITEVFKHHGELYDAEMKEFTRSHHSPFSMPGLQMAGSAKQSKAINEIKGTVMVIAGSGMCTGGRVKHHLVNTIENKKNTIMFVGYQAYGTLGRRITEGEKEVRILGHEYKVNANIRRVRGFSAHADRNELLKWLKHIKAPRKIFVVHGEENSALAFGDFVRKDTGWNVVVPEYGQTVTLD